MKKIYLVVIEHCNDGETTFNVCPFSNSEKAIQFFNEEQKRTLELPCYSNKKDIEILEDNNMYDLPCVSISTLYDNYRTDIHIEEREIL